MPFEWLRKEIERVSKETGVDPVDVEILLHDFIDNGFEDYVYNSQG